MITPEQYAALLKGIHPNRVKQLRGMSHVEAWDIRRSLIRIFGFGGFTVETKSLELVSQTEGKGKTGRPAWTVVYRAEVRLTILGEGGYSRPAEICWFEDAAAGDSVNQPSLGDAHDMAMKTSLSQALKRCAVNLGDQFGLSLYNDGSVHPVVKSTLRPPKETAEVADDIIASEPVGSEPVAPPEASESAPEPAKVAEYCSRHDIAEAEKSGRITTIEAAALYTSFDTPATPDTTEVPELVDTFGPDDAVTDHQRRHVFALLGELGIDERDERLALTREAVGRPEVTSYKDLSRAEAESFISFLKKRRDAQSQTA